MICGVQGALGGVQEPRLAYEATRRGYLAQKGPARANSSRFSLQAPGSHAVQQLTNGRCLHVFTFFARPRHLGPLYFEDTRNLLLVVA
jgi:hypothetical protein